VPTVSFVRMSPRERLGGWIPRLSDALPGIVAGAAIALLLFAFVTVDPPAGVTASASPNTDEAWHVLNARNAVLLGRWSTDDYNLHLITVPFSAAVAVVFEVFGVGLAQARSVAIIATGLSVALLALALRPVVGRGPALLGAVAFGTSSLVLYYGRLAFLEPVVTLFLIVGFLLAVRPGSRRNMLVGIVAGVALALAVGSKASAIFPAVGILIGAASQAIGGRDGRRWLAGAVVGMGLTALAWVIVVGLPNQAALPGVLATLPGESLPRSLAELVRRVGGYVIHNDRAAVLALPLIVGGIAGAGIGLLGWARLTMPQRRLLAAAIGWLAVGIGVLFVVPYRPNRYVEPMLPALASLVALGCAVVRSTDRWMSLARPQRFAAAAIVVVALGAQGLILDARWMSSTPSVMMPTQARVQSIVPRGAVMQGGYAPLLGMTTPAVTIVPWPGGKVNGGDLYATRGVRWVVGVPGTSSAVPSWARLHPLAWAGRHTVLCAPWGGAPVCLWSVP
jgi:4-amino-4-deoxy-L-arabinose transferase-like glycosyltransferase